MRQLLPGGKPAELVPDQEHVFSGCASSHPATAAVTASTSVILVSGSYYKLILGANLSMLNAKASNKQQQQTKGGLTLKFLFHYSSSANEAL